MLDEKKIVLVMDELTRQIQGKVLGACLQLQLMKLGVQTVSVKLEIWKDALESNNFRLSRTKIDYMKCKFSKSNNKDERFVRLDGREISKSERFDIFDQ